MSHLHDILALAQVERARWSEIESSLEGEIVGLRVNTGRDFQSDAMGNFAATETNTATSTTATTLVRSGASWTTNQWANMLVFAGSTYGVILSNTSTTLTVDKWYAPATPGGAAATTPGGTSVYVIAGWAPASWIALTENNGAPAAGDTTLTGELTGTGLTRALATYAHTTGTLNYTLTKVFTCQAGDTPPKTPAKLGVFNALTSGRLVFETLISSPPTLLTSDQLTVVDTVDVT